MNSSSGFAEGTSTRIAATKPGSFGRVRASPSSLDAIQPHCDLDCHSHKSIQPWREGEAAARAANRARKADGAGGSSTPASTGQERSRRPRLRQVCPTRFSQSGRGGVSVVSQFEFSLRAENGHSRETYAPEFCTCGLRSIAAAKWTNRRLVNV